MRFARRFASQDQLAAFRRTLAHNNNFDTFMWGNILVLFPKGTFEPLMGWAKPPEDLPKHIPTYGIWF
jgi:hypothetical protein